MNSDDPHADDYDFDPDWELGGLRCQSTDTKKGDQSNRSTQASGLDLTVFLPQSIINILKRVNR